MIHTDGKPTIAHYGGGDGKASEPKTTDDAHDGFVTIKHGGEIVGHVTPEFRALLGVVHKAAADEIRALREEVDNRTLDTIEAAKLGVQGAAKGFAMLADRAYTGAEVAKILTDATEGI